MSLTWFRGASFPVAYKMSSSESLLIMDRVGLSRTIRESIRDEDVDGW